MSKKLKATHTGELKIGESVLPCAVLEDGTRVLSQGGFLKAIGRSRTPKAGTGATVAQIPTFLAAKNIQSYLNKDLEVSTIPIEYEYENGRDGIGYRADALPQVCEVFLKARDDDALKPQQAHIAVKCDILMRGLAHVGITALVDEVTGYQADRARDELEKILSKFIAKEFQKWIKTFPDDFYEQMFRLKGWRYDPFSVKRPSLVGKYTNDLVYDRLAPGVLDELKRANPKSPKGNRRYRHHQWLTEDIGHPRLREHLSGVIALMKVSRNWDEFKRHLNRIYKKHPKVGQTLALPNVD